MFRNHAVSREDLSLFLRYWIRAPLRTGAVLPSGLGLARAMAQQVHSDGDGVVVEIGAGTGAVTQALLESGVPPDRLVVVERNPAFCRRLRVKFKDLQVVHGDARYLQSLLARQGVSRVGTVVSSLPLLSLSVAAQQAVLRESFSMLGSAGSYVQFTYGLLSPVDRSLRRSLGLRGYLADRIWRNLPPASVWCYEAL